VLARKVCNFHMHSAPTFAADVMWCTMPLIVLVFLLSVVVGGLHVCISLHHTAIAKVVMKGVVVIDETPAHLTPTPSHDCFMKSLVCDTEKNGKQKSICLLAVIKGTFLDGSPELFDTVLAKLRRQPMYGN